MPVFKFNIASIFLFLYAFFLLFFLDNPFFWDGISHSSAAIFYFNHGLGSLLLPVEWDFGHPPLFNLYLYFAWVLSSKTLFVSHLAMIPICLFGAREFIRLAQHFLTPKQYFLVFALFFFDPTFLAQSTLISADIPLLAFHLAAFNAIINHKKVHLSIWSTFIILLSIRGIFADLSLLLFFLIENKKNMDWKNNIGSSFKVFFPAMVMGILWYSWHYLQIGWVISSPEVVAHRQVLDLHGMIRNTIIFIWRFLDFGRVFWISLAGLLLLINHKSLKSFWLQNKQLLQINLLLLAIFGLAFLPLSNPIGHRYLMVPIAMLSILASRWFAYTLKEKWISNALPILFSALLLGGNFWVYPDTLAQGWDSSLAYLQYKKPLKDFNQYLQNHEIQKAKIYSGFPFTISSGQSELKGSDEHFISILESSPSYGDFVLQSNISNDFSDAQIVFLQEHAKLIQEFTNGAIHLRLYQMPLTQDLLTPF